MKKVFLIVTLLVLGFGLVACGGNSKDITPEKTPSIINEDVLEEEVLEEEILEEEVLEEEILEEEVLEEQQISNERLTVDQSFYIDTVARNIERDPKAQSALSIGFWSTDLSSFNLIVREVTEEVKIDSVLVFVENIDTNEYIVQEITDGAVLEFTEFEMPENDFDRFIWGIVTLNEDGQLLAWGFDRIIKKNVL